jgi:hypothetical protein
MQRNDMVALVAGASVGVGGGAPGAFQTWTVGRAAAHHFLDQLGDHDIELRQPPPSTARHGAQQASPGGVSVTQLASNEPLPKAGEAPTAARTWQAVGGQMAMPGNRH